MILISQNIDFIDILLVPQRGFEVAHTSSNPQEPTPKDAA